MPTISYQGGIDDLVNLDSKRAFKALFTVLLAEINALRTPAGLATISAQQALDALITAYKNS